MILELIKRNDLGTFGPRNWGLYNRGGFDPEEKKWRFQRSGWNLFQGRFKRVGMRTVDVLSGLQQGELNSADFWVNSSSRIIFCGLVILDFAWLPCTSQVGMLKPVAPSTRLSSAFFGMVTSSLVINRPTYWATSPSFSAGLKPIQHCFHVSGVVTGLYLVICSSNQFWVLECMGAPKPVRDWLYSCLSRSQTETLRNIFLDIYFSFILSFELILIFLWTAEEKKKKELERNSIIGKRKVGRERKTPRGEQKEEIEEDTEQRQNYVLQSRAEVMSGGREWSRAKFKLSLEAEVWTESRRFLSTRRLTQVVGQRFLRLGLSEEQTEGARKCGTVVIPTIPTVILFIYFCFTGRLRSAELDIEEEKRVGGMTEVHEEDSGEMDVEREVTCLISPENDHITNESFNLDSHSIAVIYETLLGGSAMCHRPQMRSDAGVMKFPPCSAKCSNESHSPSDQQPQPNEPPSCHKQVSIFIKH
ncbi:hypothetical protein VP01_954g2 [Puccinia sorghi]|uniref:Uncharacterized protein n=1 Tax=Puccinia sorghi TaxID=27349 RepID=A0A0L6U6A0_9BASI|nr:hypothetical protein VP01_954g2 [Puccinia sorghi]